MPHINIIEPEQATGEIAEFFTHVQSAFGTVPTPLKLYANHHPKVAQAVFNGFGASMMHSSLSQPFFAWIRYLVAHNSDCTFCIDVNAGMLLQMGASQENLQDALEDATTAPLPEKEKALLSACIQVIRDRCTLQKEEIDHLKRLGNTDTELVAAFHHAAHSQAADMMINAFGL